MMIILFAQVLIANSVTGALYKIAVSALSLEAVP